MTIGQRIKKVRTDLGISQVDFAKKIKVSKQTLYKYENNIIQNIPQEKIELIAKYGKVAPQYLMGWDKYNETAKKSLRIEFIEDLLVTCGWNFDEHIDCIENTHCPLTIEQRYSKWLNSKNCKCCSNCKYNQLYLYINNGKKIYKMTVDDIDKIYDKILNYASFNFNEHIKKSEPQNLSEYGDIRHNAIYSNYDESINIQAYNLANFSENNNEGGL